METQETNAGGIDVQAQDAVLVVPKYEHEIEALSGAISTLANEASSAKFSFEKELLELRSDLAGLDARVAGLEGTVSILTEQLNTTLTLLRDINSDTSILQALEAQVNALTLKTKAGFEHLGINMDNLSGRNRRA